MTEDMKFKYLINGEWYFFTMREIEEAMVYSEVMCGEYEARCFCIGEKDSNGADIYTDDKVMFVRPFWDHNGDVAVRETVEVVVFEGGEINANNFAEDLFYVPWKNMTVIGNIHDKQEGES
jgi:hypothetical protein